MAKTKKGTKKVTEAPDKVTSTVKRSKKKAPKVATKKVVKEVPTKKAKAPKAPSRTKVICTLISERKHTDEQIMKKVDINLALVKRMRYLMNIGYISGFELPKKPYLAIDEDGKEIKPLKPVIVRKWVRPDERTKEQNEQIIKDKEMQKAEYEKAKPKKAPKKKAEKAVKAETKKPKGKVAPKKAKAKKAPKKK